MLYLVEWHEHTTGEEYGMVCREVIDTDTMAARDMGDVVADILVGREPQTFVSSLTVKVIDSMDDVPNTMRAF